MTNKSQVSKIKLQTIVIWNLDIGICLRFII